MVLVFCILELAGPCSCCGCELGVCVYRSVCVELEGLVQGVVLRAIVTSVITL